VEVGAQTPNEVLSQVVGVQAVALPSPEKRRRRVPR
jgi:hypothetical protein